VKRRHEITQRLGRKALEELAAVAKPDTLLAWYRKLIANKFDGSKFRQPVGRPRIDEEAERLVENSDKLKQLDTLEGIPKSAEGSWN
jgi:hypothetical protein